MDLLEGPARTLRVHHHSVCSLERRVHVQFFCQCRGRVRAFQHQRQLERRLGRTLLSFSLFEVDEYEAEQTRGD